MPQRPDGKPASTERVTFTRQAAERIAKTVRTVESGDRKSGGISFGNQADGTPRSLRVGTFTGSWATGTYKTVTLVGSTATASVYNWCRSSEGDTASSSVSQFVVFGRAMGTNSVLEISLGDTSGTCRMSIAGLNLATLPGFSAGAIQLLGHTSNIDPGNTNATTCVSLQWYSITTCSTAA